MYPVFHPSPHIHIPIYLVVMSLAFSLSIVYFYKRAIKLNLPPKISTEISIMVMIGAFLGSRLFHIIFEYPQYYINDPLEVFKVHKGGFVFYGGLIGGLLTSYVFVRKIKQNYLNWLDCSALVLPLGYIIGRIGCIFAGCCFGRECDLPWAMKFPEGVEAPANILLHPTQIYSIIIECLVWLSLFAIEKKKPMKSGSLFAVWLLLHSVGRIVVEQYRGDFRGAPVLGLSVSSLISLIFIVLSSVWLLRKKA